MKAEMGGREHQPRNAGAPAAGAAAPPREPRALGLLALDFGHHFSEP